MIFDYLHRIQGYALAVLFVVIATWAFPVLGIAFVFLGIATYLYASA
jgi:hypothetical protein